MMGMKKFFDKYSIADYKRFISRRIYIVNSFIRGRHLYHEDKKMYCAQWDRLKNERKKYSSLFKYDHINDVPCYIDRFELAGKLEEQYFFQDIYMANRIINSLQDNTMHYDIGSRLDGFIAHLLAADIPVTMIDIRPLNIYVKGLSFARGNASSLDNIRDSSIKSISCLHALEHFGLGRYGDPIDPLCWYKALKEFCRVLEPGGKLYLSVPIGQDNQLLFNAQRIFRPETIVNVVKEMGGDIEAFSYIKNAQVINAYSYDEYKEKTSNLCGLFEFRMK